MLQLTTPKQHIVHRLKICAGHLQAVQHQVENDAECLVVTHHIQAIESAIKKIELLLIKDFLLKHSESPEALLAAIKVLASSSLHLSHSRIHPYQEKRSSA